MEMWPHAIAIDTQFNMQAQFNGRLSNVFETSRKAEPKAWCSSS